VRLAKRRRVRPDDPVAVVTRFLDAANHHDADGLRACVHPEFESYQPLHPARNFRGAGQLISNWKAIFEAEPGFRLTLLRASTTGNTVWAEVHGAGASAEAAGIFIVGVEEGRIRWIRVYSDLVEPLPEQPVEDVPAATPGIDWDRDPIRLVTPRDAADTEAAETAGDEAEPAAVEEPEVAAASGDVPALRLVGAEPLAEEPEAVTAADDEAPEAPEMPVAAEAAEMPVAAEAADVAEAPEAVEARAEGPIEVLVGEAPAVESEAPAVESEAPVVESEAPAVESEAPPEDEAPGARPTDQAEDVDDVEDEEPPVAWWDTVAHLGAAAEPRDASEGRLRRRLGFLRRGSAR
jgi:hypothetical protein